MANLPLAFAEAGIGAILLVSGVTGTALGDTIRGHVTMHPLTDASGSAGASGGTVAAETTSTYTGPLAPILATIRHMESGGNYTAYNAGGGASGAYQYIQSTWSKYANAAGYGQYANGPASAAPPSVQDAVAAFNVQDILNQYGSVADVPLAWYYPAAIGNSALLNTVPNPSAGNTQTPAEYQSAWLNEFHSLAGSASQ